MLIIRMKFSRCVKLGTKRDPHSWAADVRSQYVGVVFSSECCLLSSTAFWSNYWPELLPSDSVPCPNISMIKWVVQDRTLSYNRIEKIENPSIEVDVAQLCLCRLWVVHIRNSFISRIEYYRSVIGFTGFVAMTMFGRLGLIVLHRSKGEDRGVGFQEFKLDDDVFCCCWWSASGHQSSMIHVGMKIFHYRCMV